MLTQKTAVSLTGQGRKGGPSTSIIYTKIHGLGP